MKHYTKIILLLLVFTGTLQAQSPTDRISSKNFNSHYFAQLILDECNHVRDSLSIHKLVSDSILTLAARNQSVYISKTANLDHFQPDPLFATVENRVEYFKGTHEKLGEIVDILYIDKPVRINKAKTSMKILTYREAAYFYINNALNTTSSFDLLTQRHFYNTGIEFTYNAEENAIYVTQVMGSRPYKYHSHTQHKDHKKSFYPSKKANIENAYGLKPYDQTICEECISEYNKVPDYIAKELVIENGKIYYHFGDLEQFEKTFPEGTEAIAVDLIHKDQFPCEGTNITHRSQIHDGLLYKPMTKADLLKYNTHKEQNEIFTPLGVLPSDFSLDGYECNLLLIKNNTVCRVFRPVPLAESSISLLGDEFYTDTTEQDAITKKKNLRFTIMFERGKDTYSDKDIKPIYDSLQLNKFNIKDIIIFSYSSIEGTTEDNVDLQQRRAESISKVLQGYQLDTIKTTIKTFENWDQFYREIKNTKFAYLASYDKPTIKKMLAENDSLRTAMEPILRRHRKAMLFLKIEEKLDLTSKQNELPVHFQAALKKKDWANATIIQRAMFNAVEDTTLSYALVDSVNIPMQKECIQLLNNDLIFRYNHNLAGDYIKEMEAISALDPSNVYFKFNLYEMMLRKWKESDVCPVTPETLIKNIKTLYNTKLDKKIVNRLFLNYYILVTGHYNKQKKYKLRDDAIGMVKKYYKTVDLSVKDMLAVANYFELYNREAWALEILYTYMQGQQEEINEEVLFYFLSIAIANAELFDKNELVMLYLQKARDLNKERFCKLYGSPKVHFQFLKDEQMKKLYCESCQ